MIVSEAGLMDLALHLKMDQWNKLSASQKGVKNDVGKDNTGQNKVQNSMSTTGMKVSVRTSATYGSTPTLKINYR
jgi:hypothetical protein